MIDWILQGGWIVMCCICGPIMMFIDPEPRRIAAPAKPKPGAKRKAKAKQKRKKKKQKKAKPYKAPALTAQQEAIFYRYKTGRDFAHSNVPL